MNRAATLLLLVVLLPSPAVSADSVAGVASVIDGDTIEIHGRRIRLWGIDALEAARFIPAAWTPRARSSKRSGANP